MLATEQKVAEFAQSLRRSKEAFPLYKREDLEAFFTKSNFVMQAKSVLELGGEKDKTALLTCRSDDGQAQSGAYLFGPDLPNLLGKDGAQSIGIVIEFAGAEINDELFYMLQQNVKRFLHVKGSMIRAADCSIWMRFSQEGADGLKSFLSLAEICASRIQNEFPEVKACRIYLISEEGKEMEEARFLAEAQRAEQDALKAKVWKDRGFSFEECHVLGHCGQCSDKKLCANIRKMERIVKVSRKENQSE